MRLTTRWICLLVVVMIGSLAQAKEIPFSDAKIIIEFNSTAEDIGVQVFLDAEGWQKVSILAPNGTTIFESKGFGKLKQQGMTELFFESEEPSLDEVPLQEFLSRFPEGEYQFVGTTTEGDQLVGTARFTHNIPDGPSIVSPERSDVLDPNKVVIDWDPVTTPAGIIIDAYEVIVEGGRPARTFDIFLSPEVTRVKVPNGFLEPGRKYKFEVLAKERSGNQTISEGSFRTTE